MPYPSDPAIVFDTEPGDMFVMRNVANIAPKYAAPDEGHHGTCAALEYAVTALKVPLLMVMGHAQCGGAAHALSICSKVWLLSPGCLPWTFGAREVLFLSFAPVSSQPSRLCTLSKVVDP